eukprot:5419824-Amphidinium_carterae.1
MPRRPSRATRPHSPGRRERGSRGECVARGNHGLALFFQLCRRTKKSKEQLSFVAQPCGRHTDGAGPLANA